MKTLLRFTRTQDETGFTSMDQVNKVKFDGLCCYDITDAVDEMMEKGYDYADALEICARLQAENDNWHCHNSKGKYVVFEGPVTGEDRDNQDRFGNIAVIAKIKSYIAHGTLEQLDYGYRCSGINIV